MNRIRSYAPLVITVVGGVIVLNLALVRLIAEPAGPGRVLAALTVLVYLAWKVLESRITVHETTLGENHDRGTVELCACVEIGLLIAVFTQRTDVWFPAAVLGLMVLVTGLLIRFSAIGALGDGYSLRIREIRGRLIKAGPYSRVRHPSYLGTAIVHTGLVCVFPGVGPFLFLALWYGAVALRARTEDRFLMNDPRYINYSTQTPRMLFPGIY